MAMAACTDGGSTETAAAPAPAARNPRRDRPWDIVVLSAGAADLSGDLDIPVPAHSNMTTYNGISD
ncbi:hypothetical protein Sme01_65760 [Sphaerisporangium melleum]|uniref:Uncharacterized protein n=1 Tax=Sphaerisporangium melleum TaxID=321316 RepID=A0A917VQP3_9ACTN|nr:hypothetical protein GCM10007964_53510 [Sphaerisporangium melleum]GII74100.1 hypothetical protein Sme01_65760 [Sphaerisporangium melleum]